MPRLRTLLFLLVAIAASVLTPTASAAGECHNGTDPINDWKHDGVVNGSYSVACLNTALSRLGADNQIYTEVGVALREARAVAMRPKKKPTPTTPSATDDGGDSAGSDNSDDPTGSDPDGGMTTMAEPTVTDLPTDTADAVVTEEARTDTEGLPPPTGSTGPSGRAAGGPLNDLIARGEPDKADDVPMPVIVLAILAVLLIGGGAAGLVAQRRRGGGRLREE